MLVGYSQCLFQNRAAHTAVASTSSEASLLAGTNNLPFIPRHYFDPTHGLGKGISLFASGVFSNTGTPTQIFQVRISTTGGSSTLSGTSLGVSAAITTGSGVTDVRWDLEMHWRLSVSGQGTGNSTLDGSGWVASPAGFASPFRYDLEATTPPTATWTTVFDNSLDQFINLSMTWSANSASNTITCKYLRLMGWN